jgi:protein TonB
VAIYLHRLQAEEGAVADAKAREVAQAAHEAEPAARKRKSKGAPVSRKTGATPQSPEPAAPAPPAPPPPPQAAPPPAREPSRPGPEVFGSLEKSGEAEKASRTPLVVGVVAAALALVAFLAWKFMKPQGATPAVPVVNPTAVATAVANPTPVAAAPVPTAAPGIDPKAVEAEVQRQLAARRKELEKTAVAGKKDAVAAPAAAAAAPAPPEPTAVPTVPPTPVPAPTAVPTEPPPPPVEVPKPAAAPEKEPETRRGDLVGPGTGVIEPQLITPPRVVYPAIARQQRVEGKVVVLVLVDENGKAVESRLQQGVSQAAVNDAVLAAVRGAKFRPATKNGIPVKMWRPFIVEVKP